MIVPGKPEESRLVKAIRYGTDSYQMPPKGKLPAKMIADFERWIAIGAPDPRRKTRRPNCKRKPNIGRSPRPAASRHRKSSTATGPARISIVSCSRIWRIGGLCPRQTRIAAQLIRRLSFDLIGLPPTFAEVEAFLQDQHLDAREKLVDQLLASPHFGERWARYWLGVARYADTKGYVFQEDRNYPEAYTYRDWVVRAFNADIPYDRFLVAQIAGDQVPPSSGAPPLAALGFLTLGRRFINNPHDIIDDRINVVARGTMALTVSCAGVTTTSTIRFRPPNTTRSTECLPARWNRRTPRPHFD